MKCNICKKSINETFLRKLIGTYVKDENGKKHAICSECQGKLKSKDEILTNL